MSIIMHDTNFHAFLTFSFNKKTFWCTHVFNIDPSKRGFKSNNVIHQLLRIHFIQFNIKRI